LTFKPNDMKTLRFIFLFATLFLFLQAGSFAQKLPNIHILATGGTIAGTGTSTTGSSYRAGQVAINELISAVPELKEIANITGEQIVKIGSQDMSDEVWLKLAHYLNELLQRKEVDGVVITHGTDTMEETAFFLNLTVKSNKPVVLVGAMRPATSLSADGPLNLYNAVVTAGASESVGRGVMIVMNGSILGAHAATKMNTINVQAFQAPNSGALGYVFNGKVHYNQSTDKLHTLQSVFDVTHLDKLPKVGIVYSYSNVEPEALDALITNSYQGIVHAGVGNGNIHKNLFDKLVNASKQGILVVRSSRVPTGPTTLDAEVDDTKYGFVASQELNPQKARILLMLALIKTKDPQVIQNYFNAY
jgi:asparaginase (EC 3.5.1.1)